MDEELKNSIQELMLVIQGLDLSDEAKENHYALIQAVLENPTTANVQALLVVLEATAQIHSLSIQSTIDELKLAAQI